MNQQKKRSFFAPDRSGGGAPAPLGSSQVELSNAQPPDDSEANWTTATRVALLSIAFITIIVALYLARSILMPISAALIIGITMRPVQIYLARYRVPGAVTALLLIAVFVAVVYAVVTLVAGSLSEWVAQSPDLGTLVREKMRWVERPLATLRDLQKEIGGSAAEGAPKAGIEANIPAVLQGAVGILTPALSELLLFVGTLLFFLVGTEKLRRQLITLFETRDARLTVVRIWSDIENNLVTYVGMVTLINLGLAAVTAAMLFAIGFPSPIGFGALAFVLNYVPYIGPAIMVATLFVVGLIASDSLGGMLLPPLLFVAITTIEGHVITPSLVGRKLTLSPFLVFLALAFWTWLWGPLGAFMATPLLIVGLVVLGHLFPREDAVALPK